MCLKNLYLLGSSIVVLSLILLTFTTPAVVHADKPYPVSSQNTCISCHEDLYFLHDTGKWFCLREAPMACVDCHGGNPIALTKNTAHAHRAAHPVANENISKCQECHPEESIERVQIFRDVAGIGPVIIAAAYVPVAAVSNSDLIPVASPEESLVDSKVPLTIIFFLGIVLILIQVLLRKLQRGKEMPQ